MRFMIIMKSDESAEAGEMPDEELLAEMTRYNEELANAGVMQAGEGLQPSSKGARVTFRNGRPTCMPLRSIVNSRIALSWTEPRIFSTVRPRFMSPNIST